jgi:SsrA-binding protein
MEVVNKKAPFNFLLSERLEAGIALNGSEAQAIRRGRIDLSNSYVKIIGGETFLVNASIPVSGLTNYVATRSRKLLLHKKEILSLSNKVSQQNLTLIATKVYTDGHLVKLEIALAKGKKQYEKKASKKLQDLDREAQEEFRNSF